MWIFFHCFDIFIKNLLTLADELGDGPETTYEEKASDRSQRTSAGKTAGLFNRVIAPCTKYKYY